jgi:hypothetical protein
MAMAYSMTISCTNVATKVNGPMSDFISAKSIVASGETIVECAAIILKGRVAGGALLHMTKKLAVNFCNVGREAGIDYERR